jgi:hypothetical protein
MREIDPVTQCEIITRKRVSPMLLNIMMYSAMSNFIYPMPKLPVRKSLYYEIFLTKQERKGLSYEDQQELKRYKWTLEMMHKGKL